MLKRSYRIYESQDKKVKQLARKMKWTHSKVVRELINGAEKIIK